MEPYEALDPGVIPAPPTAYPHECHRLLPAAASCVGELRRCTCGHWFRGVTWIGVTYRRVYGWRRVNWWNVADRRRIRAHLRKVADR